MDLIVCLDERDGMMFNQRRQSRDRAVIEDVLALAAGRPLWMNAYSAPLFAGAENVQVSPQFLAEAPAEALCFVEDQAVAAFAARIARVIVYRWHRVYPADRRFDLALADAGWWLAASRDFPGHSHDIITREEYER